MSTLEHLREPASSTLPPYLIERARTDDALGIARVTVNAWRAAYAGLFPQPMLDALSLHKHAAHFQRRLLDGRPEFFVCRANASVQAWIAIERRRPWFRPWFDLSGLYVDPKQWRRGIGAALWRHVQTVTAHDPREVRLWVVEADERARAFYAAIGFRCRATRRTVDRGGVAVTEVAYRGTTG